MTISYFVPILQAEESFAHMTGLHSFYWMDLIVQCNLISNETELTLFLNMRSGPLPRILNHFIDAIDTLNIGEDFFCCNVFNFLNQIKSNLDRYTLESLGSVSERLMDKIELLLPNISPLMVPTFADLVFGLRIIIQPHTKRTHDFKQKVNAYRDAIISTYENYEYQICFVYLLQVVGMNVQHSKSVDMWASSHIQTCTHYSMASICFDALSKMTSKTYGSYLFFISLIY